MDSGGVGVGEFFSSGGGSEEDLIAAVVFYNALDRVVVGPVGEQVFPILFRTMEANGEAHYSRFSALTRQ